MKRLLAIDDSLVILSLIKDILSGHDYQVDTANNGKEGLEKYAKFMPDIVTLDLSMPDMDGYETLAALKRIDKYANVLMITASDHSSALKDCLEKGAVGFLSKPFKPKELLNAIERATETNNYVNRNITSMFSLVSDKFQNSMNSMFPSSSPVATVVVLEDVKVYRNTVTNDSGGKANNNNNSSSYDSVKPSAEHVSFITEIEGRQTGLVISLISESDFAALFGSSFQDLDSNSNKAIEFFNILNSKVLSQLADATKLNLKTKRTLFLSKTRLHENFWPSTANLWNQIARASFNITYNQQTLKLDILLCYDAGRIFL